MNTAEFRENSSQDHSNSSNKGNRSTASSFTTRSDNSTSWSSSNQEYKQYRHMDSVASSSIESADQSFHVVSVLSGKESIEQNERLRKLSYDRSKWTEIENGYKSVGYNQSNDHTQVMQGLKQSDDMEGIFVPGHEQSAFPNEQGSQSRNKNAFEQGRRFDMGFNILSTYPSVAATQYDNEDLYLSNNTQDNSSKQLLVHTVHNPNLLTKSPSYTNYSVPTKRHLMGPQHHIYAMSPQSSFHPKQNIIEMHPAPYNQTSVRNDNYYTNHPTVPTGTIMAVPQAFNNAKARNHQQPSRTGNATNNKSFIYRVQFKLCEGLFVRGPNTPDDIVIGEFVRVEADRNQTVGVITGTMPMSRFNVCKHEMGYGDGPTGIIVRLATKKERSSLPDKRKEEFSILQRCKEVNFINHHLPLVIQDVEMQFDRKKLVIYYNSPQHIDFRSLVAELFVIFKCRIWMENIALMIPFTPQDYAEMALLTGEYHYPSR
eukprot:gene16230-22087_t